MFATRPNFETGARASDGRPAEDGATGKHLGAQGGRFAVDRHVSGTLKLAEQVEQQQDGLEGSFGGEELLQTETVSAQVVPEFGDAVFHVSVPVVVAPDFLRRSNAVGDEEAKGVVEHLEQFAVYAVTAFAQPFAATTEISSSAT